MPDLSFTVRDAATVPYAAVPTIGFTVAVENGVDNERVESILLNAQIRIETTRRSYSSAEKAELVELFGAPERWGQTLRSMLLAHTSVCIGPFTGETSAELPLVCTFDMNVAATKYFNGLEDGEVPLEFLFSGTVFHRDESGALQASPISWEAEAAYGLPLSTWTEMMALYYPNSAWLNLRRDVFDRIDNYRIDSGLPTFEAAFEKLLPSNGIQSRRIANG